MGLPEMRLFFDEEDHELLRMLDALRPGDREGKALRKALDPCLHPRGIKELGASRGLRIAGAMIDLLRSLEDGKAPARLQALKCVRDEALANEQSSFKRNAARALLQIMKELVRCKEQRRRLELAHEFRSALAGKPRVIRELLRSHKLLEMPEEWNQVSFDDHVHDANTKGRKSPTHLIMDAWIKGIRSLTVIYYNAIGREAAREILEAASTMEVSVRIGVEFSVPFRGRQLQLIWVPRGFSDAAAFDEFLAKPEIGEFMAQGEALNRRKAAQVVETLGAFNADGRLRLNRRFSLELGELSAEDFAAYVSNGQMSQAHLAEFVFAKALPLMAERVKELLSQGGGLELASEMNLLDPEAIAASYLPKAPPPPEAPWKSPGELLERLRALPAGFRLTLNMSELEAQDVLEALFLFKGAITHLEAFNLKDHLLDPNRDLSEVYELRDALNGALTIRLKSIVRALAEKAPPERAETLREILRKLPELESWYKERHLGVRIGSDSTERSRRLHGMGFVVPETLPWRARAELKADCRQGALRMTLPLLLPVRRRSVFLPIKWGSRPLKTLAKLFPTFATRGVDDWVEVHRLCKPSKHGNIATMGGFHPEKDNGLIPDPKEASGERPKLRHLNSSFFIALKILCGFVPAFLTFLLTKDWWLLAYFGAFIWFGITGARNILMSVLGGGGLMRSPLLPWSGLVNWTRLADSLMFTGFSVPLLDYVVKTLLLDRQFGITVASSPIALYAVMGAVNGAYLATHNIFRGFSMGVTASNLFRSLLSIPVAWLFNMLLMGLLGACGVPAPAEALQKWAAIISKAASDCVAGVIEGTGDRLKNIRLRLDDYAKKNAQLFETYAKIELLLPEEDVLKLLEEPAAFVKRLKTADRALERELALNALDLLHIWWRQPRASGALKTALEGMDPQERAIFARSQIAALSDKEGVEKILSSGLGLGRRNSAPLKFYQGYAGPYIAFLRGIKS